MYLCIVWTVLSKEDGNEITFVEKKFCERKCGLRETFVRKSICGERLFRN